MKFKSSILALAAFASAAVVGTAASAGTTLFSYAGPTPEFPTDSFTAAFFSSPGGPAVASFIIDGYASLDGQNSYEDDFYLLLNGASVLSGTFNLGGGGANVIYSNPNGATVGFDTANGTNITFGGGKVSVEIPLDLTPGFSVLTFGYTSLSGPGYAGFQGLGDEGWGLEQLNVATVPEPATWAMMLIGFAGLGGALRARRKPAVATA